MTTLNLSLPDNLKAFVEEQAAAGGYDTAGDYVRSLIREARDRKEIEDKLLAALETEPSEMQEADWDRMRERVRLTAAKR